MIRNPERSTQTRPFRGNTLPTTEIGVNGGVFLNPRIPISSSFPPLPPPPLLPRIQPQQPPLLPLPVAFTKSHQFLLRPHGQSLSPVHRKQNNGTNNKGQTKPSRRSLVTPTNKPINSRNINNKKDPAANLDLLIVGAAKRLGPDPEIQPTEILTTVLLGDDDNVTSGNDITMNELQFSGSVFDVSPPPSSLPLPKFSLRPKLSCNFEAASSAGGGVDTGATDNLCRLLKLRSRGLLKILKGVVVAINSRVFLESGLRLQDPWLISGDDACFV